MFVCFLGALGVYVLRARVTTKKDERLCKEWWGVAKDDVKRNIEVCTSVRTWDSCD